MWVNKQLFNRVFDANCDQIEMLTQLHKAAHYHAASIDELRAQKAKDDMTIDWMRHRLNALEKERAILLNKIAGIHVPVPEIVPTRPGTLSRDLPDFDSLPSFEDVGDQEALRLGIKHTEDGTLKYT
jgi:hypothetical protein